jgi:hypothetical protein
MNFLLLSQSLRSSFGICPRSRPTTNSKSLCCLWVLPWRTTGKPVASEMSQRGAQGREPQGGAAGFRSLRATKLDFLPGGVVDAEGPASSEFVPGVRDGVALRCQFRPWPVFARPPRRRAGTTAELRRRGRSRDAGKTCRLREPVGVSVLRQRRWVMTASLLAPLLSNRTDVIFPGVRKKLPRFHRPSGEAQITQTGA